MVTVRVEESIIIAVAVVAVFAYTADVTKTPEWASGVVSMDLLTEGPITVGSMARQEVAYRGRRMVLYFQVTAYEPGALLAFSGGPESASHEGYQRYEEAEGGARVTLGTVRRPTGPALLLIPFIKRALRAQMREALRRLKTRLEDG